MEASGTFDGDAQEVEDRLDDAETIGKARQRYRLIADLRKELAMHVDRAKDTKKRIDGLQSEIEVLICDPKQLEIPTTPAPEEPEAKDAEEVLEEMGTEVAP